MSKITLKEAVIQVLEGYYDQIACDECGNEVCGSCGCCCNEYCPRCSCPEALKLRNNFSQEELEDLKSDEEEYNRKLK